MHKNYSIMPEWIPFGLDTFRSGLCEVDLRWFKVEITETENVKQRNIYFCNLWEKWNIFFNERKMLTNEAWRVCQLVRVKKSNQCHCQLKKEKNINTLLLFIFIIY